MFQTATFILSFITWILLSGKFDPFHLTLGVISCLIVVLLTSDLLFKQRNKGPLARLAEALRFIPYCVWLLREIVLANFHVIGLAILPTRMKRDLDPNIFNFKTSLKTDFAKFILANSITLTPGTVTIRIEGDVFYVHAISRKAMGDFTTSESMSEMERRVAHVFEGGNS